MQLISSVRRKLHALRSMEREHYYILDPFLVLNSLPSCSPSLLTLNAESYVSHTVQNDGTSPHVAGNAIRSD
jgi:hypothetical protein